MKTSDRTTSRRIRPAGHPPRVLLVIPTANIIHRQILNGILRYAHQHGPWEFHMITGLFEEQGIRRTKEWGCTGAIAFADTKAYVNAALTAGVPVVFINPPRHLMRAKSLLTDHCRVLRDHLSIGLTGADYFIDRQYTHFAFVGDVKNKQWSSDREKGFANRVAEQGYSCDVYPALSPKEHADFGLEGKRLLAWLKKLPKPVAVMAARDQRARQILDICMDEGLSVPHEVAVLGVGNDDIFCETTTPSLSSIELDGENTGYDCAKLLAERMNVTGHSQRPCVLSLSMARVVTRRSTDTSCVSDPLLVKAMAFIQGRLGSQLTVADVARHLNISRRLLEMKARKYLGRTICDEIQRLKLNRARSLLRNTKMTVSEIALACGYYDPSHLGLWFRKTFHLTPTAFRDTFRKELS
jgi:LacI family transcriptional regulator